jgi:hypothetical protein
MGWENRNGREYYYRKTRIGKRVISEYVGSGFIAELIAEQDDLVREQRRQERLAWDRIKSEEKKMNTELDLVEDLTRALIRANLLIAGFHPHKGQWRRRRSG